MVEKLSFAKICGTEFWLGCTNKKPEVVGLAFPEYVRCVRHKDGEGRQVAGDRWQVAIRLEKQNSD